MYKNLDREKVNKFIGYCEKNVILFDGAMGTQIQAASPAAELFGGYEGFNEQLNITAPEIIKRIHSNYLEAGANAIETNSFSANGIVMAEYGIHESQKVYEICKRAAEIGKEATHEYEAKKPGAYFVAGSIGPSTKLPSLGHISFKNMAAAYEPQVEGLMDGGADILLVETCQDILQVKCLLHTIAGVFLRKKYTLPVMASVTLQQNGSMLIGSDIGAVSSILEDYEILSSIGFNCALGPFEMEKHVERLCESTNKMVSAMPNAGLPENVNGRTAYKLTPAEFAGFVSRFVEKYGVSIIGGCCGTTPEHIKAAAEAVKNIKRRDRKNNPLPSVASLYNAWTKTQTPKPFIIGERTNANGSKAFRELLLKNDYDAMVSIARNQQNGGAHAIDLCVAYVGRDEKKDMLEASKRFASSVNLPLVIDSTDPDAIETALESHGGKCIINSINLEDGGAKLSKIAALAKMYNAALIALTIDEKGMAKTVGEKLKVASRIYEICVNEYQIPPHDIIFDALTFTVGSGDESLRDAAVQTAGAISAIKNRFPESYTSLGISNVSFGLKPAARAVVNSIFLKQCTDAGLDMAIINPAGFLPIHKIEKDDFEMAENLLLNRWADGKDPLLAFLKYFDLKSGAVEKAGPAGGAKLSDEEKLMALVVDGEKKGIDEAVSDLLKTMEPLSIINGPLINAMKKVGELFGAGVMQLPFVLQSAEAMKTAVTLLEKYIEKSEYSKISKIVLATVSGDVHDIGKNLVDIILSNNGFEVINIGIKVPVEEMINACVKNGANIIGMSGLLVRSTQIMRENLLELERRGLKYDVILGGAALTRKYVEEDLAGIYSGRVFYAEDAFSGLSVMKNIVENSTDGGKSALKKSNAKPVNAIAGMKQDAAVPAKIELCDDIPVPPFFGRKVLSGIDPVEVYPFINKVTLFRGQWQYKRGNMQKDEYDRLINETVEPAFTKLTRRCERENIFDLKCVYGYYPCSKNGDSIDIFDPDGVSKKIGSFGFPRQKFDGGLCIADFVLPPDENGSAEDLIGLMVVTCGGRIAEEIKRLYSAGEYKDYLLVHGLSVEMAEALTEYMHVRMRRELGIYEKSPLGMDGYINQKYRGSRYSFGYPACPDLGSQKTLFNILRPEGIGVSLTETMQMTPEQSTSSIVVHHPQAKYFAV